MLGLANLAVSCFWLGRSPSNFYIYYTFKCLLLFGLRIPFYLKQVAPVPLPASSPQRQLMLGVSLADVAAVPENALLFLRLLLRCQRPPRATLLGSEALG